MFPARGGFALFLLVALFNCGGLEAKEPAKSILDRLPERIGDCQKANIHEYDDARLGASVSYKFSGMAITVYVFDLGIAKIADGLNDTAVQNAFSMAKSEILAAQKRGDYSDVRHLDESRAQTNGKDKTLQANYELVRQVGDDKGLHTFSQIHVFGAWNQIFKVRITGARAEQNTLEPAAEKFVTELVKAVEFLPPARP